MAAVIDQSIAGDATAVIESICEVASLRDRLRRKEAIDVLWLLNGPAVFHHLTRRARWSTARYEHWLAETMCQQLLDPNQRGPHDPGGP